MVLPHAGEDFARGRPTSGQPRLPGAEYDIVVVSLGTNDYDRRGLEAEVRELAVSRGGLPLVWLLPLHATRPDVAGRRVAVVEHIRAGLEGVPGVRIIDPPVVSVPDGVHATRTGYTIIARELERAYGEGGGAMVVPLIVGALAAYAAWRWFK
jgi:lysophospholipase L1-like esterase